MRGCMLYEGSGDSRPSRATSGHQPATGSAVGGHRQGHDADAVVAVTSQMASEPLGAAAVVDTEECRSGPRVGLIDEHDREIAGHHLGHCGVVVGSGEHEKAIDGGMGQGFPFTGGESIGIGGPAVNTGAGMPGAGGEDVGFGVPHSHKTTPGGGVAAQGY